MTTNSPISQFLELSTRFLFFTGKGGVGKTSLACASAIALADRGKRVLLVSTDPASNLDEVLDVSLAVTPTAVPHVSGLFAMNIDPEEAAKTYRERIVGPIRSLLPETTIRNIEEQLSGACTTEIASFNEFSRLLGDEAAATDYEYVILDTAPTGHTLRLLALPAAWTDFIAENTTGSSCLGPMSGLADQREVYERALDVLKDPEQTTLTLVARADNASLKEAERASGELKSLGINSQVLILNAVFKSSNTSDSLALSMEQRAKAAIETMPDVISKLPRFELPYQVSGLSGINKLRAILSGENFASEYDSANINPSYPMLDDIMEKIAESGHGVIMTMGKGGVGKTTLAKRIASELVARGHKVHLSTTDPANQIEDIECLDTPLLSVSAIDPAETTRRHVENILAQSGKNLDPAARALLEEELRSPCTEEIAVFTAFAHEVAKGADQFVVLDTAPTGHTLLLLDATEAYHREVLKNANALPEAVQSLLPRLRDPNFTKVLIVTLPEATPVHEAAHLQEDLRRAEIEPFAWIVNQCIFSANTADPLLLAKAANEKPFIDEVSSQHAKTWAAMPWTTADETSSLAT